MVFHRTFWFTYTDCTGFQGMRLITSLDIIASADMRCEATTLRAWLDYKHYNTDRRKLLIKEFGDIEATVFISYDRDQLPMISDTPFERLDEAMREYGSSFLKYEFTPAI